MINTVCHVLQNINILTVGSPNGVGGFFPEGLIGNIATPTGYNVTDSGLEDFPSEPSVAFQVTSHLPEAYAFWHVLCGFCMCFVVCKFFVCACAYVRVPAHCMGIHLCSCGQLLF